MTELRGTGRSTARCLQAIADALLQPDEWVCVVDHAGIYGTEDWLADAIDDMARALSLSIDVESHDKVVRVRSPISRLRNKSENMSCV